MLIFPLPAGIIRGEEKTASTSGLLIIYRMSPNHRLPTGNSGALWTCQDWWMASINHMHCPIEQGPSFGLLGVWYLSSWAWGHIQRSAIPELPSSLIFPTSSTRNLYSSCSTGMCHLFDQTFADQRAFGWLRTSLALGMAFLPDWNSKKVTATTGLPKMGQSKLSITLSRNSSMRNEQWMNYTTSFLCSTLGTLMNTYLCYLQNICSMGVFDLEKESPS